MKLTERELIKTMILNMISNRYTLDLKRANTHNFATLAKLQNVLKPIEEVDEIEQQDSSRLKQKPRIDCNKKNEQRRNNPCKKDSHNHDWKYFPDNKYGN